MLTDARSVPDGTVVDADIVVIGAGAAGITLALTLTGTPLRVVVLESGGEHFEAATQALYRGPNTGLPYFPLDTARLRFLGGSTNHWGGVCRPFDDADFEGQEWVPLSAWPISRADVAPYYERAREICQVETPDWDLETWVERDRYEPFPFDPERVVTRVAQIVPRDERSFGATYREDLDKAANVTVYLHANVTEIEVDDDATTATGVRVATLGGPSFGVRGRILVLAVGGIENPRLLLASNSRVPAGLGNRHDLVGRYFLEHPRFEAGILVPFDAHLSNPFFYNDHDVAGSGRIECYLALSRDLQRSEEIGEVQVRIEPVYRGSFEHALDSDDAAAFRALGDGLSDRDLGEIGRNLPAVAGDLMTWQRFVVPGSPVPIPYPEVLGKILRTGSGGLEGLLPDFLGDSAAVAYRNLVGSVPLDSVRMIARINPVPNPASRVTLARERDALGMPLADLDWQLMPEDMLSVRRTFEILGREIGAAEIGRLKILVTDEDTPWPADLTGGWHHMGTTRMSDDPATGVVDRNLQVHGMGNLYVAGSSVFPSAGSGTPTMTLVALALRLADHLKERTA